MRPLALATLLTLGLPAVAVAQDEPTEPPEGWMIRTDRPDQDPGDVAFMDMPPGWHVTTGPAAILWHPDRTASGEFRVEMEVYLFDPRGRHEGFGMLVGGEELDGPGQRYLYFLLREGGEFLVKRRDGERTEVLLDWAPAEAMTSYATRAEDEATAHNLMAVEADDDTVRFLVNGEEVGALPRESVDVDGVVGMRVNHGLNIHVSRLDVEGGTDEIP